MDLDHERRLKYDARLYVTMPQAGEHDPIAGRGYYGLVSTLALLAPFLLYTKGGQLIKSLQQSRSKAKVPFFWAVASLAHVLNVYMILKILITTCHPYRPPGLRIPNCTSVSVLCGYILVTVCITACVHSKYVSFPIPKTLKIVTNCCKKRKYQVFTTISLWGIYCSATWLVLCLPFQVLLVSANPHLYGFGILTVWCAMFVCIIVTSIPFTIDQIFIKEVEYRITPKQALRQILLLTFIAVLVFGFGSLTFSITLVLQLSKYGEKTQSVSKSVYFVLRYTALPIASWIIQVLYTRIKLAIEETFQRQDLDP